MTEGLAALALRTQDIYERNARRFDSERPKGLHERSWLDRFTAGQPAGAAILDLGCGAGDPIALHLAACGFRITGIDASREMIGLARARLPGGDWRLGDMRDLDLGQRFDGIIGWNSFFHLTREEQRALLPRLANHLNIGGALMLTVGPKDGEVGGQVGDDPVYHSSLAPADYREILVRHGVEIAAFVVEDPECDAQTVLLGRKSGESA